MLAQIDGTANELPDGDVFDIAGFPALKWISGAAQSGSRTVVDVSSVPRNLNALVKFVHGKAKDPFDVTQDTKELAAAVARTSSVLEDVQTLLADHEKLKAQVAVLQAELTACKSGAGQSCKSQD